MLEVRIHGRGGQGVQVGCQILAEAFFQAGAWVQAFAAYGGERRGAPVTASLRVDERPIRRRSDVTRPDHLLVLDPSLLDGLDLDAAHVRGIVLVNSTWAPCSRRPSGDRLVTVDASDIAQRIGLGPIVATAVIGAFAGATRLLSLGYLTTAVEARSPAKAAENVAACRLGYLAACADGHLGDSR